MNSINKLLSAAVLIVAAFTSCKKDNNQVVRDDIAGPGLVDTIYGNIASNRTLRADTTYYLRGLTIVKSGATLTIPAGTTIKGITRTGEKGVLLVAQGGKLVINGTAVSPVVFTSANASPASGDWGGIIILGNAPANNYNASTPTYIEGVPNSTDSKYGGTASADNSGTITYARIEYAGGVYQGTLGNNNEVNGLTLGGVGSGTTIHHVQVSYSGDDSYEFFGGTVSPHHLISLAAIDDDFDFDNGYNGKLQFLLAVRNKELNDQSNSNGIESDNDAAGSTLTPATLPIISNLTILGNNGAVDSDPYSPSTKASTPGAFQADAHFRRNSGLRVRNSVFLGFPVYGLLVDGSLTNAKVIDSTQSEFRKNLVHTNNTDTTKVFWSTTASSLTGYFTNATNGNTKYTYLDSTLVNTGILVNAWNTSSINSTQFFVLNASSPAATGADFSGTNFSSGFTSTTYKGAFPVAGGANWATLASAGGWTKF